MFSIYLNDEMELIGRHGDLYADYIVPKELRVRDLCVKTFNYYRMESECTLVCANGRVPNGDGNFHHESWFMTHELYESHGIMTFQVDAGTKSVL